MDGRLLPSARWRSLGRVRQLALLFACALALALALCAALAARDSRVALYPVPLRSEQVRELSEQLAAWNIPHAPAPDNIRVDAQRRGDALLRLALAGLPHDHVAGSGEVLAALGALTPQSVIEAQTRAGLAGDIALALRSIDGIADATAIIAPAQRGVYADESAHEASAAVHLRLHPGVQLSAQAVGGIRNFVASAVPGLAAARVTMLDDRGVALRESGGPADEATRVQASLQSALDAVVGAGSTVVRVRTFLDERVRQTRDVRRLPGGRQAIARARSDERFAAAGKHYSKLTSEEDRGSDVHEESTAIPPGRIERLSVAIAVDAARAGDLARIRALAAAAAGIDARRGDTLTVEAVTFAAPAALGAHPWILVYGAIAPALPICSGAVVFLAVLRCARKPASVLVRAALRAMRIARTQARAARCAPHEVRAALDGEPPYAAAAVISGLPAATAAAVLDLYPADERAAIVRRMARPQRPLITEAIHHFG